jgi:hypothetical protein
VKRHFATLLAGWVLITASAAAFGRIPSAETSAMLPDRYLQCVVGRSTNLDPKKWQKSTDVISEGRHRLELRLPPIAVRKGDAPDPNDPPEPVDVRTRILADPDGLTKGVSPDFLRVADLWPKRVELLSVIPASPWMHMMIIDPIDPAKGRAHLFMARVKDAATMDLQRVYQGDCQIVDPPRQISRR